MKKAICLSGILILHTIHCFAQSNVIELLADDAGKYNLKKGEVIVLRSGIFKGSIALEAGASLEVGPEAVFQGVLQTAPGSTISNKGLWKSPLVVSGQFESSGPVYAHHIYIKTGGLFVHEGPAKMIVDQQVENEGVLVLRGIAEVGNELINKGQLKIESGLMSIQGPVYNKGIVTGGENFGRIGSIRTAAIFYNYNELGGVGQFLDVCANAIEGSQSPHPRVSMCAQLPKLNDIKWLQVDGYSEKEKTNLNWFTAEAPGNKVFVVQRSENGSSFSNLAVIESGEEVNSSIYHYSFEDQNAQNGTRFYRIMEVNKQGEVSYSKVISLGVMAFSGNR